MQIDVVTRACSNRTPSFASRSIRGVRTILFPAAPSESLRTSSLTSSTMFSGCREFRGATGVCAEQR
jgi:hypothetical protein